MKKLFIMFLQTTLFVFFIVNYSFSSEAVLKADYQFNNNLKSSISNAPDLIELGQTSFENANVDDKTVAVLKFEKGAGLTLENCSQLIPKDKYTIVVLFSFDNIGGYKRIIDFKNRKSDTGLYTFGTNIKFYNVKTGTGNQVKKNVFLQVVITRDKDKNLNCYIENNREIRFVDNSDFAVISEDNILSFFRDDGGSEHTSGAVARIRLYDNALSTSQITSLDRLPNDSNNITSISGCVNAGEATKGAKVMLLQSGEIHKTISLDDAGCYLFNSYNISKPFTLIVRGKNNSDDLLSK